MHGMAVFLDHEREWRNEKLVCCHLPRYVVLEEEECFRVASDVLNDEELAMERMLPSST